MDAETHSQAQGRGAVCFIVDGKEVKRYKNIEIPDEIKKPAL